MGNIGWTGIIIIAILMGIGALAVGYSESKKK